MALQNKTSENLNCQETRAREPTFQGMKEWEEYLQGIVGNSAKMLKQKDGTKNSETESMRRNIPVHLRPLPRKPDSKGKLGLGQLRPGGKDRTHALGVCSKEMKFHSQRCVQRGSSLELVMAGYRQARTDGVVEGKVSRSQAGRALERGPPSESVTLDAGTPSIHRQLCSQRTMR